MEFGKEGNDANADVSLITLIDHLLLLLKSSDGSAGHVKLEGTNTGAVADIHNGLTGDSRNCYGINIYVNNNVQGVNNSIVLGSDVRMNDPGVHSSFRDMNLQKRTKRKKRNHLSFRELNMKKRALKKRNENKVSGFDKLGMCLFLFALMVIVFWVLF